MLFDHDWQLEQLNKGKYVCVFAVDRKHHRLQSEWFCAPGDVDAQIKNNKIWYYKSVIAHTREEYDRMIEEDKKKWAGPGEYRVNKFEPQTHPLDRVGKGLVILQWALEVGLFLLFFIPILSAILKIK